MLSRRVNAYYGLIRASGPLPSAYLFADRSLPCGHWPAGPCFCLRILLIVPPSVPRRTGQSKTIGRLSVIAFARMRGARRPRLSHLNRYTWAALSRLQCSLDAAARSVASPSPTRTFTFELSFHESPQ